MNRSVAAVVVTYNRWRLLIECLDSLLNQSTPLDAIYIVDNASSDGTEQHLRERGYLSREGVHFVRLEVNSGGAGGFFVGMDQASRAGHGWIWIMDDDAEPKHNALEMMHPLMHLDSIVAVANAKIELNNGSSGDHIVEVDKRYRRSAYIRLSFSSFVGLLVRTTAIEKVGLPKMEFFIYGDDNEYCNRLAKVGDIALAPDSVILHKALHRGGIRRRRLLWREVPSLSINTFCFSYFHMRNILWTCLYSNCRISETSSYKTVFGMYAKVITKVLFADRDHFWLRCQIVFRAFSDGVRGKFDNSFAFMCLARAAGQTDSRDEL